MSTLGTPPRYCAWLLRCWEVRGPGPGPPMAWRCSLEDPHTGEQRGFARLEALSAFLQDELVAEGEQGRRPRAPAARTGAGGGDGENDARGRATADRSAAL